MPTLRSSFPVVWIIGLILSCATLAFGAMEFAVPSPETTGNWSFYGILICAIIVLGLCIAFILRWVATTWLKSQADGFMVLTRLEEALSRHTEALNKNTQWFEKVAQNFVQHGLDASHLSLHRREVYDPEG